MESHNTQTTGCGREMIIHDDCFFLPFFKFHKHLFHDSTVLVCFCFWHGLLMEIILGGSSLYECSEHLHTPMQCRCVGKNAVLRDIDM